MTATALSADALSPEAAAVLAFWFEEHGPKDWFAKNPAFDAAIAERFGALHARAARGALDSWAETPKGALALIIVLDQFSRNMHRDGAKAFACDAKALGLARRAVERGFDDRLDDREKTFLYLPFEHSETPADQELSIRSFAKLADKSLLGWAEKHKMIIDRFGRFPHRNKALGRASTLEETAFLAEPGSGF